MDVQDLLKPRYKVTADYPGSNLIVGEIFIYVESNHYKSNSGHNCYNPESYPAIFHKLEWWEERKVEDMPEYVKMGDGKVVPFDKWKGDFEHLKLWADQSKPEDFIPYKKSLPATEAEYNSLNGGQNKKL